LEIQAAHDRLKAIVLKEVPWPFPNTPEAVVISALDVLCWVLQHEHNQSFADNLTAIDAFMSSRGLGPRDIERLS
jgi:hypothetical protein